jgi:hypothetical protein
MLAKIGEGDTAWIAADRAAFAAESLSNPLAVAASLFPDLGQISAYLADAVDGVEGLAEVVRYAGRTGLAQPTVSDGSRGNRPSPKR